MDGWIIAGVIGIVVLGVWIWAARGDDGGRGHHHHSGDAAWSDHGVGSDAGGGTDA